jgi:hypothetical protein
MQGKPQKRQAQKMDEWMDEAACKARTHTGKQGNGVCS